MSQQRLWSLVAMRWAFVCGTTFAIVSPASAQMPPPTLHPEQREASMAHHAAGTFDITLAPQKPDSKATEGAALSRMSIEKEFHGDLEANSLGEMLSAITDVKGSAAYVALERVNGKLLGRTGTFLLQHNGTMTRGIPHLTVAVVPDSGTGELHELSGTMTLRNEGGQHFYTFDFVLPDPSSAHP